MPGQDFKVQATRGFLWNYLYKISEFGLINLYTIVVVRHFGPAVSAPYAIFLATASILTMVGAFAVDGVLLRFIQRVAANPGGEAERFDSVETLSLPHFLNTLLSFRVLTVTALSVVVLVVLWGIPAAVPSAGSLFGSLGEQAPLLVVFLFAQAIAAFSTFALTGLLETKFVFIASLVARLALMLAGVLLLGSATFSTDGAIAVCVGSYVLSAAILLAALRHVVKSRQSGDQHARHLSVATMARMIWQLVKAPRQIAMLLATPLMIYGVTTWGNDLLSMILGKQSDVMVMGIMLGDHSAEIGYYQAASLVLLVTEYVFLFGLGGTLVSIFSKLAHDDDKATDGSSFPSLTKARREIAGYQNVVLLPLCLYVLFFTESLVPALFGSKFIPAVAMVRVGLLALITSVGVFGGGMQVTSLVSIGKERLVFKNRLFWGVTNMVANVVLIHYFGGMGALIGTQYANLAAVATEWYFSARYIANSTNAISASRILLISFAASGASYVLIQQLVPGASPWVSLIGGAIANSVIVMALYRLFRVPEMGIVLRRLRTMGG